MNPTPPEIDAPERREAAPSRWDVAKIIDRDAWHNSLPRDGCGAYWYDRRHKALAKADAILELLAASSGERGAALEAKVRHLTQLLDEAHGTPCAQIAWEQERGEMRTLLDKAFDAMCAARPVSGDDEAFQDVIDEIGMYRSDKWITIKVEEADRADWPQKSAEEISEIIREAYLAGGLAATGYTFTWKALKDAAYDYMMSVGPLVIAPTPATVEEPKV